MRAIIRNPHIAFFIFILICYSCTSQDKPGYHHEGLKVTAKVHEFVAQHDISGTELEKVHKIIEITHDRFLFTRIDRRQIQSWIEDPIKAEEFRNHLDQLKKELDILNLKRKTELLSEEEIQKRKDLQKSIFFGEHDLRVYQDVFKKKSIYPADLPFVVTGSEAVEYGIQDGCTTFTKTFIVLAKASELEDLRFVPTGNTEDYNRACPQKGEARKEDVTINGHFFALVKIEGKWALVNCTYFEPYAVEESQRYEVFFELEGEPVSPETLKNKRIRVPSFQREGNPPPPKELYVIAVGKDSNDDLDIENYRALMNMSVSGNCESPICIYDLF